MFKKKNRKKVTMLLVLIICISSLGFTFAEGDKKEEDKNEPVATMQGIFQDARDDNNVQEAAVKLTKPMARVVVIGFTVLGLIIASLVFWYGGTDLVLAIRGKRGVSRTRIALLVTALMVGIMFFSGGIFEMIGMTDRIIVRTVENIMNS